MKLVNKGYKGFTLIELMIVMSIASLLIGFVGPLAMNAFDRAQAKQELLSLKGWLKKISVRAFTTGTAHRLILEGKRVKLIALQASENTMLQEQHLEYVFFQPQVLEYSSKGFVSQPLITGTYRNRPMEILLSQHINGQEAQESLQE